MTSIGTILAATGCAETGTALQRALDVAGVSLEIVETGKKAQERIQQNSISLVIADTKLKGLGGVALARWMDNKKIDLPIILVGDKRTSSNQGYPTLIRPIDPHELMRVITQLVEQRRTRDQFGQIKTELGEVRANVQNASTTLGEIHTAVKNAATQTSQIEKTLGDDKTGIIRRVNQLEAQSPIRVFRARWFWSTMSVLGFVIMVIWWFIEEPTKSYFKALYQVPKALERADQAHTMISEIREEQRALRMDIRAVIRGIPSPSP